MEPRLPAHLEVAGLIRAVEAAGGFAAVLRKGEREAGTILVLTIQSGTNGRLFERMPSLDGQRKWHQIPFQDTDNKEKLSEYLYRRGRQDGDLWIIELDIANGERFIGLTGTEG
ncbi:MAG: DUF1491 family protein [Sphingomonadales bacterium]|nr:DUF1491 family protein [Sphingomonadales bacterium]